MRKTAFSICMTLLFLFGIYLLISFNTIEAKTDDHSSEEHSEHSDDHREEKEDHDATHEDDHSNHGDHHDEEVVQLSESEIREFGIETSVVDAGVLKAYKTFPGEVVLNPDMTAHVVPRISGVIRKLMKGIGDRVRTGETIALLDSRELAEMKSGYLAARERVSLTKSNFKREEGLWKKKISSEQEYLEARQALAESKIEMRLFEQKLYAVGLSREDVKRLISEPHSELTMYKIVAPISGIIIKQHATMGEYIKDDSEAFVIADTASVRINVTVYQKDLASVRVGHKVTVSSGNALSNANAAISYISPILNETTRTVTARVELPNRDGRWRPGMFVNVKVISEMVNTSVLIPRESIQNIEGKNVVFIKTAEGFEPQKVVIGRKDSTGVEITSGLDPGQTYVTKGAFTLKAQLAKGSFGDGHAH